MNFYLVSEWHLAALPEAVWSVLDSPEFWPQWWPEIRRIETVQVGGRHDEGAVRRTWWNSRLPYGFVIDFTTRAAEQPKLLVVEASGDLVGMGDGNWPRSRPARGCATPGRCSHTSPGCARWPRYSRRCLRGITTR